MALGITKFQTRPWRKTEKRCEALFLCTSLTELWERLCGWKYAEFYMAFAMTKLIE
jgi:hypothetical protein